MFEKSKPKHLMSSGYMKAEKRFEKRCINFSTSSENLSFLFKKIYTNS